MSSGYVSRNEAGSFERKDVGSVGRSEGKDRVVSGRERASAKVVTMAALSLSAIGTEASRNDGSRGEETEASWENEVSRELIRIGLERGELVGIGCQ